MSYRGRGIVVTGAGGGLGAAVARHFALHGAKVACADVAVEAAAATAEALVEQGGQAHAFAVDIADERDVSRFRDDVVAALGPVHVLLNIAGVLDRRPMVELPAEAFRGVVDVNLSGTYAVIRIFADDLRAAGRSGRIVNVASIAGTTGYPFPAYAASKAGVVNLTRSLLIDFWGSGVTVNAVSPGAMDTPMMDQSSKPMFLQKTPVNRIAATDDIVHAIDFLSSEKAAMVNGQNLVVDGGATAVFRYVND
ncbi:SDR family oxidoreductase [Saccharopolyspora erythraea]|nr:SDR family oxidoreductase [Saccharopolyspora erythraea]